MNVCISNCAVLTAPRQFNQEWLEDAANNQRGLDHLSALRDGTNVLISGKGRFRFGAFSRSKRNGIRLGHLLVIWLRRLIGLVVGSRMGITLSKAHQDSRASQACLIQKRRIRFQQAAKLHDA
jgi:hypothetical protein